MVETHFQTLSGYNVYMKRSVYEYDMRIIFTKILYFSDSLIPDALNRKYAIYSTSYIEQVEQTPISELFCIFQGISTKGIIQIMIYMSLITKQWLSVYDISTLTKTISGSTDYNIRQELI